MTGPVRAILVTGGAGFIGSAVCRHLVRAGGYRVVNLDKLTYAGNLASLAEIEADPAYRFVHGDIADSALVRSLLDEEEPTKYIETGHVAKHRAVDDDLDGVALAVKL